MSEEHPANSYRILPTTSAIAALDTKNKPLMVMVRYFEELEVTLRFVCKVIMAHSWTGIRHQANILIVKRLDMDVDVTEMHILSKCVPVTTYLPQ
jgi:hypothetical protein